MPHNQISEIDALFKKAEQLRESGNREEALKEYTKVIYFAPRHWPAYFHLGVLFGASGHHELAAALLQRASTINPDNAVIKNHLADQFMKLGRNDAAMELLHASWGLDSGQGNISALLKIGKIYRESNRPAEAIPYFNQLLAVEENQEGNKDIRTVCRWLRSLSNLTLGNYQLAWTDYEIRNDIPGVIVSNLSGERWVGQPLKGKTIFFAYEQRFGDILHFIRFLPRVESMGARIILQLPPELDRQIRYSYPRVEVVSIKELIPKYDYYQFITSVPAVLNLTKDESVSDPVPYLGINQSDVISLPMRKDTSLKVGLVWEGKPDPDRGIPLTQYIPLLKHQSVSFYSFQLGDKKNQLYENAVGWLIHDLSPKISDFYDSSTLLKDLDLLISIDTAIVHQAGALGVPVWVMLRHYSDWRWELDRNDNPWYPTMRLFRQEYEGSWSEAGRHLERAFDEWVQMSLTVKSSVKPGPHRD